MTFFGALLLCVPLSIAIGAAVVGIAQLRDALTFDQRALGLTAAQALSLRLQLDEETGVRGYAATRRRVLLDPYRAALPKMNAALNRLGTLALDIGVADGRDEAARLQALNARWRSTVADRLVGDQLATDRAAAVQIQGKSLVDAYRRAEAALGKDVSDRIADHTNSTEQLFARIAVLFLASMSMGVLSTALAARRAAASVRERSRARALSNSFQRAVLPPRLPSVPGCVFDAVYEPGTDDAQVGGDWYDAVRLTDGRILISIGDVAGAGVEAAVVMGVVRQIMRGIAQVHADPALMLDAADRALRLEYGDAFVTAWVGIADLVTGTLRYACAGHPPPILGDDDGNTCELAQTSLPLGLREGQSSCTEVPLRDGSTLVLYTDGLSEATRDVIAGNARVRAAASRIAAAPWANPAAQIHAEVLDRRAIDDVAILVARFDFERAEQYIGRSTYATRDHHAAHLTRQALMGALRDHGLNPIDLLNAELVLGELAGNVVRHTTSEAVELALDFGGGQAVLHVLDRGPGFRHLSRLPADPFCESGRGLFLIAALTDDFTVAERTGGGSHARAVLIGRARIAPVALTFADRAGALTA